MAETYRDIILKTVLKVENARLPKIDTSAAEKSIKDFTDRAQASTASLAKRVADDASSAAQSVAGLRQQGQQLADHWNKVNAAISENAAVNRVRQKDTAAAIEQEKQWIGILGQVNRELATRVAAIEQVDVAQKKMVEKVFTGPINLGEFADPRRAQLWQDFHRARIELDLLEPSLIERTEQLKLLDAEFKRAQMAGGGFNADQIIGSQRDAKAASDAQLNTLGAARRAGEANLARSIANEKQMAAARAASAASMHEESVAARVWIARLKEMETAETLAAAASTRTRSTAGMGGFFRRGGGFRGGGIIGAAVIGALGPPDAQLSGTALQSGEAARKAQDLSNRFNEVADKITIVAGAAALINPALIPVAGTVAIIAQGAKAIANSGMMREFTGIEAAAKRGEELEQRRLTLHARRIEMAQRELTLYEGQRRIAQNILDRERARIEAASGRRLDNIDLIRNDPLRKQQELAKERQRLGGELGGVNQALLQNQIELQQTGSVDLRDPRNRGIAKRHANLLKQREELLGVLNARGNSLLELSGRERDNAADLARGRSELLGRLQDHFDLTPGERVRSQRDKRQKRQLDDTYESLDRLGIRREQADSSGEVDALIKREREKFATEDRAREGEIKRIRTVMEASSEQQAEVNDLLEDFALQQESLNKTTTAVLDRLLQAVQRAKQEREQIFMDLMNR